MSVAVSMSVSAGLGGLEAEGDNHKGKGEDGEIRLDHDVDGKEIDDWLSDPWRISRPFYRLFPAKFNVYVKQS